MELSQNKYVAFVAGASHKNSKGSTEGVIAALSFQKNLTVLCEQVLLKEKIKVCTAMARIPGKDDLVLGGYKDMLIVRYLEKRFTILTRIKLVHTSKFQKIQYFLLIC